LTEDPYDLDQKICAFFFYPFSVTPFSRMKFPSSFFSSFGWETHISLCPFSAPSLNLDCVDPIAEVIRAHLRPYICPSGSIRRSSPHALFFFLLNGTRLRSSAAFKCLSVSPSTFFLSECIAKIPGSFYRNGPLSVKPRFISPHFYQRIALIRGLFFLSPRPPLFIHHLARNTGTIPGSPS